MKVYIFTHESLDNLKINIDFNYKKYKECSNGWIKGYLGYDPFVEFNKSVGEFELDPQAKEIENTKILYTAMKNISDSEATDERLWAGLSHNVCWDFMRKSLEYEMENNSRIEFSPRTILNRYFYNLKVNGRKRSIYINTLAKMWWLGRLCYNKENQEDPFKYLELFETAFSHKLINTFSSNILGNPKIRFAYFDTGLYIKSLGIPIKGDTLVPLLMYLNELGGRIVLDILEREEIYEMLVNFAINNLDEIKSR